MIRWIVEGRLGTAPRESIERTHPWHLIDTRTLVDKRGNSAGELLAKINEGVEALKGGSSVVVVCDFGVSRSNAIAAGILTIWRSLSVDAAVAHVVEATGETAIKLDMIDSLREAFEETPRASKVDGILITGGSGFIGRSLRDSLAATHRVFAPGRTELDLIGPVVNLDRFCRDNAVSKIVHLAYPRIYTNNDAMGQSLTMLRGVLDVCKAQAIELILPSSWVVFSGYRTRQMEADVNCKARPRGVYGEAKYLEEVLVRNCIDNGEISGTMVRMSPVYGAESQRPRLIRFAYQYLSEDKPIVTHRYRNGLPLLQMLYVDDAVAGLAEIARGGRSPIYHLGGSRGYEPREIIAAIANLMGKHAAIDEISVDDDTANVMLDFSLAEHELGWRPTVDLEEGLRRTLARGILSDQLKT